MRYTTRIIVPPRIRRSGPPGSPGGAYGPQVLGVRKTFGFGDRLGAAAGTQVALAAAHPEFAPVLAQQSPPEMQAAARTPADVLGTAARAVGAARFRPPWGADADRLQTAQDVAAAAEAGYTCFTFDPSGFVRRDVDELTPTELERAIHALIADGDLPEHWMEPYLDRTIDLPGNHQLRVEFASLQRAVVRYAPAVLHCARLSSTLARSNQGRPFEVGVALDAVRGPTSTLEHLFVGLELEARGVRLTSLALSPGIGPFDAVPEDWERQLREHVAVAEFCGPYKLGFEESKVPAAFLPVVGRTCGETLHFKTSGTSFLEAMRVAARMNPPLFGEMVLDGLGHSAVEEGLRATLENSPEDAERLLLDQPIGRHYLDAGFSSMMLTGQTASGQPFRSALGELLSDHADLYAEVLTAACERQFAQLNAG